MRPSHAPLAALVLTAIAGTPAFADPTPTATRVAPANAPAGQALPTPAPKAHPAHSPKGGKHAKGGQSVLGGLGGK
jgi:hypothetical protein